MDYPSNPALNLHPLTGKFTDGVPASGILASKDSAEAYNQLWDELLNLITAAGLTPAEGDLTQVEKAVEKIVDTRAFKKYASMGALLAVSPFHSEVYITSYHDGKLYGGGHFIWDADLAKSEHNGGTIISPTVPWDGAEAGLEDFLDGVGETDPEGTGCYVRRGDKFSILDFGGYRDGEGDDSIAGRHLAALIDANKSRYLYFPNFDGTYLVKDTISFNEPGVRVFGDAGPTYQRGTGKDGTITFDDTEFAGPVLDLGNSRTTGNPADQWTVEGLDFLGTNKTVNAIDLSSQTNGPDRGVLISKCSGKDLNSLVHITPDGAGVATSIANLEVVSSNLSNNRYGVLSEGNCLGLRFVGNQAEQCTEGAIYGEFSSGITIEDNMLEGQPTPITIFASTVGGIPKVSVKRNYFEANSGDYLMSLSGTTNGCYAELGPNFNVAGAFGDYCRIDDGAWIATVKDPFPLTLSDKAKILSGSDIFHKGVSYYETRGVNINTGNEVQITQFNRFLNIDRTDYEVITATGTDTVITPFGTKADGYSISGSTKFFSHAIDGVAGDLVVYSILMRVGYNGTNNTQVQVYDSPTTTQIGQVSDPFCVETDLMGGEWALVQLGVVLSGASGGTTKFRFFNFSGTPADIDIAAICARNYGPIPGGGKLAITPLCAI